MKTVMQFLSLILCFELVLGPVQGSLLLPSVAMAQDCPAGQQYSSAVNRCLTKHEVLKMNQATESCGDNKECYKTNAINALMESSVSKDNSKGTKDFDSTKLFNEDGEYQNGKQKGIVKAGNIAAIAIPTLIVTTVLVNKAKAKKANASYKCNPPSLLLMYAGAAALGAGEIYGYFNHKAKLKKIQENWDKTVIPKSEANSDASKVEATEAQSQAFEFLAQNEEQVAKTAKTKKGFYLAATGLFAAGAIAAAVEQVQLSIARGQLANPSTSAQGQQTIDKLTCQTENDGKADKDRADEKTAADTKEKAEENAAAEEKAAAKDEETIKNYEAEKCNADPACKAKQTLDADKLKEEEYNKAKENKAARDKAAADKAAAEANKPKEGPKTQEEYNNDQKACSGKSFTACDPTKCKWINNMCSASIKFDHETTKMKRVAAHNLSQAKDIEQLLELMKEFDAVEFENYSKVSYLSAEEKSFENQSIPAEISRVIAENLMPSAFAQSTDTAATGCDAAAAADAASAAAAAAPAEKKKTDLLGIGMTALPLLLGLKQILGGVKFNGGTPLKSGELEQKTHQVKGELNKAIGKPLTRFAINGVLGGWMGIMSHHMDKQMRRSTERAVALRKMKDEFKSANGILNCSPDDRNNPCKARCYCFTTDNKVNPARSKQKACANTYAGMGDDEANGSDKICLDQNSNVDAACGCRAKNNCMRITSKFSMKGFKPGTFKMISAGSSPAQDLFNGNIGGGDVADSAGINAARIRAAADEMLVKVDPKAAKDKNNYAAGLEKGILATLGGLSTGRSDSSPLPTSPAAAAAALSKELKEEKEDNAKAAGGTYHGAVFNNDEDDVPDLGLTDEKGTEELEIADVMGQEMDLGNSDINSGSNTNIFEVLSNRYQRSGRRRLLNENAPVDAPAKTEISE